MDQIPKQYKAQNILVQTDGAKQKIGTSSTDEGVFKLPGIKFTPDVKPYDSRKDKSIHERLIKTQNIEPLLCIGSSAKIEKITTFYENGDQNVLVVKRFDSSKRAHKRLYQYERNVLSNLFLDKRDQEVPRALMKCEGYKDLDNEMHIYYVYAGEQFSRIGANKQSKIFLDSRSAVVNGMFDLTQAVKYMHDHHVHHFDIRSDNICVDDQLRLTIIDYGNSRVNSDVRDEYLLEDANSADWNSIANVIRHSLLNSPVISEGEIDFILEACIEIYSGKVTLPEIKKRFSVDSDK